MRCKIRKVQAWACCGLIAVTVGSTGCKTGWKMPGASLFSWTKKPSAETIAGAGPSMTTPQSPALSQSPSLVAGANRPAAPKANMYMPTAVPTPQTAPTGYAAATPPANPYAGMGGAATANGYATGPYNTYAQSNPYAAASAGAPPASAYAQAPMGQAAARPVAATQYPQMQSTQPSSMPTAGYASANLGGFQPPAAGNPYAQPTATAPAPSATGYAMPSGYAMTPATGGAYSPVGATQATPASMPSVSSLSSNASVPVSPASFRPGSTQRATGYDFSAPSATSPTAMPANTASGTSNPGYQMPPTGTYNR
jgi:hypothetical protein